MNVLTFKESLLKTLQLVPEDSELVLAPIMIPVTRHGAVVGQIKMTETEIDYVFRKLS